MPEPQPSYLQHPRLAKILSAAEQAIEAVYSESRALLVACKASDSSEMRNTERAYIEAQRACARFRVVLDAFKERNI